MDKHISIFIKGFLSLLSSSFMTFQTSFQNSLYNFVSSQVRDSFNSQIWLHQHIQIRLSSNLPLKYKKEISFKLKQKKEDIQNTTRESLIKKKANSNNIFFLIQRMPALKPNSMLKMMKFYKTLSSLLDGSENINFPNPKHKKS